MTIIKRNRIIRRHAETLARQYAREARRNHHEEVAIHGLSCCDFTYEDTRRNTYHHLADRRTYHAPNGRVYLPIGLPSIQRMLGTAS